MKVAFKISYKILPQILLQSARHPVELVMLHLELWAHCSVHSSLTSNLSSVYLFCLWNLSTSSMIASPTHSQQLISSFKYWGDCHWPVCLTFVPCTPLSSQWLDGCFNMKLTLYDFSFQDPLKAFSLLLRVRSTPTPTLFIPCYVPSHFLTVSCSGHADCSVVPQPQQTHLASGSFHLTLPRFLMQVSDCHSWPHTKGQRDLPLSSSALYLIQNSSHVFLSTFYLFTFVHRVGYHYVLLCAPT